MIGQVRKDLRNHYWIHNTEVSNHHGKNGKRLLVQETKMGEQLEIAGTGNSFKFCS